MPKILNVGVDISHQEHAVCLMDDEGELAAKPFVIANNRPGAHELIERLREAAQGYDQVRIGMEATGIYWWHLYRYLQRTITEPLAQPQIVVFNPKLIHGFRKVYTMDKTDPQDAFLIAERLRFGRLPDYPPPDPRYFPLQRLTRYRFHLVQTVVRTKAHAVTLLFLAASDYERAGPFESLFGATSLALLTEYHGLDEIARVPLENLARFIDEHGRHHFAQDPLDLARQLHQVAADSFPLDEDAVEPVHFALGAALHHLRFLTKQLDTLDRHIAKELERFPNTLLTVPGIGPVYAGGLIAEIGDVGRFADDDALAKYAGLWWPRQQSGNFEASDRKLSKAGNAYLRYYLCEAANSLRVHNEEYRRFYQRKYKEATKHHHKRACVLTARKLVRLVHALLRTNQLYAGPGALSAPKPKHRR